MANDLGSWTRLPSRVEVHWVDANSQQRWRGVQETKDEPPDLDVVTVGFFFDKQRSYVRIAQSLAAVNCVDGVLTIPRSAVRCIIPLDRKA